MCQPKDVFGDDHDASRENKLTHCFWMQNAQWIAMACVDVSLPQALHVIK
jgi:hypothetical protein